MDREIIDAFMDLSIKNWILDLEQRVIPRNRSKIQACIRMENENEYDKQLWEKICIEKEKLAKDDKNKKSIISQITENSDKKDLKKVSDLQIKMNEKMEKLDYLYNRYRNNQI